MSLRAGDIIKVLEELAPRGLAESWDNPGLLIGSRDREVGSVYTALDATEDVVESAIESGADMIVTHHPVIFHAIKSVSDDTGYGIKLMDLLRNDITVYSMHTNFDSCPGGMADLAAKQMGLKKLDALERNPVQLPDREGICGIGFIAELPHLMTAEELCRKIKADFGLPFVTCYDSERMISRIACCPGSGRGEKDAVLRAGVDAFITGDMGHHEGLDYVEEGIALIDAGHYGIEHIFVPFMADYLRNHFPELEVTEDRERFPAKIY